MNCFLCEQKALLQCRNCCIYMCKDCLTNKPLHSFFDDMFILFTNTCYDNGFSVKQTVQSYKLSLSQTILALEGC